MGLRFLATTMLAAFVACGCAAQNKPLPTPTGEPDITIKGANPGDVASELAIACVTTLKGTVSKANQNKVVCSGLPPVGFGESMAIALSEPEVGGRAVDEAKFTILDTGSAVRVLAVRTVATYNDYGGKLMSGHIPSFNRKLRDVLEAVANIEDAKMKEASGPGRAAAARAGKSEAATNGETSPRHPRPAKPIPEGSNAQGDQ